MQPDMQACSPAARVCRRPAIDYFYLWTRPKKRSIAFSKVSRRILIGETSLVSLLLSPSESTLENFRGLFFKGKSNIGIYIGIHDTREWKFIPVIGRTVFYRFIAFREHFILELITDLERSRGLCKFLKIKISKVLMFRVSSFSTFQFNFWKVIWESQVLQRGRNFVKKFSEEIEERKKYEVLSFHKRIELYLSFKYNFTICVTIPLLSLHSSRFIEFFFLWENNVLFINVIALRSNRIV